MRRNVPHKHAGQENPRTAAPLTRTLVRVNPRTATHLHMKRHKHLEVLRWRALATACPGHRHWHALATGHCQNSRL